MLLLTDLLGRLRAYFNMKTDFDKPRSLHSRSPAPPIDRDLFMAKTDRPFSGLSETPW